MLAVVLVPDPRPRLHRREAGKSQVAPTAAGVHLANGTHGNLLLSSLGSFVTLPLMLFLGGSVAGPAAIIAVPAAQIAVTIMIERETSPVPER